MGEDERRSAERKGEKAVLRGRWPAVKRETRTMELELRGEMWGSDMVGGGRRPLPKKMEKKVMVLGFIFGLGFFVFF
jgi:hypothetical protein